MFSSNIVSPVTSMEYLHIFSNKLLPELLLFTYSSFTMSSDWKIFIWIERCPTLISWRGLYDLYETNSKSSTLIRNISLNPILSSLISFTIVTRNGRSLSVFMNISTRIILLKYPLTLLLFNTIWFFRE